MKQTAVEWLFDNLNISWCSEDMKAFEQAKAMEKEQIKDAWLNSLTKGDYNSAQQYYNETFKSE